MLGALAFQHLGGLPPCKLCYWQRYPHITAIFIGALAVARPMRLLTLAGALATATTMTIGIYHMGVEYTWWEGPNTCTAGSPQGLSPEDLLTQILEAPVVRCDEVVWSLAGLSMAGWNVVISALLALLWLAAWRGLTRPSAP